MCCILLSLKITVQNKSNSPARRVHGSRVALAAISDSLIHFPAIPRLILAWQPLPLITDFAPTSTMQRRPRAVTTVKNLYRWTLLCFFPFMGYYFFQNKLFCSSQKVLHGNKGQTCVVFWVSFAFVLYHLWDVIPKTQPFREDFVRTEEIIIRPVFKEKIMKISIKTVDYLSVWAELHIAALTRKQGIQLSVPWH